MSTTIPNQDTNRAKQVENVIDTAGKLISDEIAVSCQEYQLLAKLNDTTSAKYNVVAQHTHELLTQTKQLSLQQEALAGQFKQLDEIYEAAIKLEATVEVLEKYMDDIEENLK